jgi:hypothetical protein
MAGDEAGTDSQTTEQLPIPTMAWAGEIDQSAGSVPGAVTLGGWFQNVGETPAYAGAGQGFMSILDTTGSVIDSKYTVGENGSSDALQPGEMSWTAATFALGEGTYGVRLQMIVMSALGDEKTAALEVSAQSVTLRSGHLPDFTPPVHLDVDPSQIEMYWSGDVSVDVIDREISMQAHYTNVGTQEVELGWVQGVYSPMEISTGAYTGQHYFDCKVPSLAPHDTAPMHGRFHLPAGTYAVTLTLQATNKVLDVRSGTLEVVENEQEYGVTWRND